jgi:F0F1-type ATP synthase delta subunit
MAHTIIVETVIPLSDDQKKSLGAVLKQKFGTAEFQERINAKILGGVRVLVDSMQYDASLAGKFAQLRNA